MDHMAMKISGDFTVFKIWIYVHGKKLKQYRHLKNHLKTKIFHKSIGKELNMMTIISSTLTRFRALSNTSPKVLNMG